MLRVLVVEDQHNFRFVITTELAQLPSLVVEDAASGREALEKAEVFLPHLIFMDIGLPDANGLQLTREIKAKYPNIRVAIMTGHDDPEYRQAATQSGADGFFGKNSLKWDEVAAFVRSISANVFQGR